MFAVLFSVVALAATSYGREFECTANEAACTGMGMGLRVASITMNQTTMCCPPTASIKIENNKCLCVEAPSASKELRCLQGMAQCQRATSFSTDSTGTLRCCMPGYHLRSVINTKTDANGQQITEDVCTCSLPRGINGGLLPALLGLGNRSGNGGGSMAGQMDQNAGNATATADDWRKMGEAWRNWGRDFVQGFHTWGRNFGQSMRNTGRDLARDLSGILQTTLTRTALPVQRALSDVIGNAFRAIPGK